MTFHNTCSSYYLHMTFHDILIYERAPAVGQLARKVPPSRGGKEGIIITLISKSPPLAPPIIITCQGKGGGATRGCASCQGKGGGFVPWAGGYHPPGVLRMPPPPPFPYHHILLKGCNPGAGYHPPGLLRSPPTLRAVACR